MIKLIRRFNTWYDTLKEPWRFLFLIVMVLFWYIPLKSGVAFGNPILTSIGVIIMVIMLIVALSRI